MSRFSPYLSPLRRSRKRRALLSVPVLAGLVALLALAVSSGGVASSPADGEDEYEPDAQVVAAVQGHAQETDKGYEHVLRWMRVLKSLGALEGMTADEAQEYAEQHLASRWDPVAAELAKLESGQAAPDPQVVSAVRGYAQETKNGYNHVLRWVRVLDSFGALEPMTAAEAQGYADRGWPRWVPVAPELAAMEGSASNPTTTPESGELEVSISASPTYPRPGNLVKLSAVIANAPAGSNPTYLWQLDLGGNSLSLGRAATASYAQSAGPASFLLTVSYPGGESATSSITVAWTETPPNLAPVVNRGAEWDVAGNVNAPRGYFITRTFTGLFSDPDGDALSYSASVPDDQRSLVDSLEIHQRATTTSGGVVDFLLIIVDSEADWKAVRPALPDPLDITVTLTATDPGGLSASVTGDFFTDWESHPALLSAEAGPESIELSFDQELQADPAPTPDQFTANVTNEDGSTGTIAVSGVSIDGKALTLGLASALQKGQTVSLDYIHDDDAPLTRAAGGGDSAPSFEAQAVELVLPNQAPVVNEEAEWQLAGKVNAPRGFMITKTFTGIFSDPDGDELSYTASVPDDQRPLVESLGVHPRATASNGELVDFLSIIVEAEADWKAVSPALPDPLTFTVTLTATDPDGLSESLSTEFFTDWESHPEVVDATGRLQAIELTFDTVLQADLAPAADQFTVNVVNEDDTAGTIDVDGVSVYGKVLTLELASAPVEGQTVSVDYAHDDETPLQRAGGGDHAPSFEAQAVELTLSPPEVDFRVSHVLGALKLLATWQDDESITSYKLRWRQAGEEFDDDAITVTSGVGVIPVSGYGSWEVRLQGCNDLGCGPETSKTVEVAQDLRLNLAPARDAQGNAPPGALTATWDPLPGATSYTLSWQPVGQPSQGNGPRSAASGSSGPEERKITVSDERTGVDIPVPNDGEYRAVLQAITDDNHVITQDTASVNPRTAQADNTPPRMVRGEIDGHRMTIYFSEPLDETAVGGRFYMAIQSGDCICWSGGAADAPMVISGNKVMVDFSNSWPRARQGLWASAAYQLEPWDTTSLRDLAGNAVQTPDLWFGGTRTSWPLYLTNLTGRPFVIRIPAAGRVGPSGVVIPSDAGADRTYVTGETIRVRLNFSEAVDVTGMPRVRIDLDPAEGGERWADFSGGSGSKSLEFDYTVAEGDSSKEGVAVLQNSLELNGGAIRSASAVGIENAKLGHDGLDHDRKHRVVTPSTAAPALFDASVTGTSLELTFSEPLAAAASLANSAFTVKKTPQGGDEEILSLSGTPAISGTMLTLTLASAVLDTDAGVKVSYQKPDSGTANKLVDAAGDETESFTDEQVRNTLDTTQPVLERAELDGDTITLFFSEPLDETTGGAGDFYRINLMWTDNFDDNPTYGRCKVGAGWWTFTTEPRRVYVDGNKVVVVGLRGDAYSGWRAGVGQRTNNLRYYTDITRPDDERLRDYSGNHVYATRTDFSSKDRLWAPHVYAWGVTELPSPERINVDGNRLVLYFDAPMDGGQRPAASAFTVKVNGTAVNLAAVNPVTVGGYKVTLILANAVALGDEVTVSYTRPSSTWLRNVICEYAPSFSDQPVLNGTGTAPAVTAVAISSDPGDDDTYGLGETIRVSLTFSEAVEVITAGRTPRLKIKLAPDGGQLWANYESGSDSDTLVFAYTVMQPNRSSRGVAVVAHSLELNGGQIRSMADQPVDARLSHTGLGHDANHRVDWRRPMEGVPQVNSAAVSSSPASGDTYVAGETIRVKLTFSEAMDVSGAPRLKIKLDPSWGELWADYESGTGSAELIFAYTVVSPNASPKGIAVLQNSLDLNGGSIRSTADATDTHRFFWGLGHDAKHKVDAKTPVLQVVDLSTTTTITLTYSEAMDAASVPPAGAFTVKKTPQGGVEETVALSGSPSIAGAVVTLTLANALLNTDRDVKVSYTKPVSDSEHKLRDRAGNEAASFSDRTENRPPRLLRAEADGNIVTQVYSEPLDTGSPPPNTAFRVQLVDVHGSKPSNDPFNPDSATISGNRVTLDLGQRRASVGQPVNTSYTRPTNAAAGKLQDFVGNEVQDMRAIRANNKTLPAVKLATIRGNQLTLTLDVTILYLLVSNPRLDQDSVPAGTAFTVKVNDSVVSLANADPVAVTESTVTLTLASAVGVGDAVTVTYTKPASSPIKDLGGKEVESFSDTSVTNLTGRPEVRSVAITSSPASGDTYALGETIRVKLTFSEAMDVTGEPRLKIKMDPTWGEFWADYETGSGSAELVFAYRVAEPNTSPRGIAVLANSLELNGGQIRSTADGTIDGILDHDGLNHNSNHKVDWRE